MGKKFNTSGVCIPERHFMANVEAKLDAITRLIDAGEYFCINRPRQYGKTTIQNLLWRKLSKKEGYSVICMSFEELDSESCDGADTFLAFFFQQLEEFAVDTNNSELPSLLEKFRDIEQVSLLSPFIRSLNNSDKKIILLIDEVDKSSNSRIFLEFLSLLRSKYLAQAKGMGRSFHSVILAGVHDVKNLKLRLRPDEARKLNSPWNIAAKFDVDLSFSPTEIETMLSDFSSERSVELDIGEFARTLYYYTAGYPFLVSKVCRIIDEDIEPPARWTITHLEEAVYRLLIEETTNSESLIKNLENNPELYNTAYDLIFEGVSVSFNIHNPLINLGVTYGIFRNAHGKLKIHNRIYELLIYDYMSSKIEISLGIPAHNEGETFHNPDGTLNFETVLLKFQEFMKQEHSRKDRAFLERNGRLIFLAFLKPILNGKGFAFKEVQISEEKRLDVVVTYLNQKYVVELKVWRGDKAHERGLEQLADYLERQQLDQGYLLIFDFKEPANKEWKTETTRVKGKKVFMAWT